MHEQLPSSCFSRETHNSLAGHRLLLIGQRPGEANDSPSHSFGVVYPVPTIKRRPWPLHPAPFRGAPSSAEERSSRSFSENFITFDDGGSVDEQLRSCAPGTESSTWHRWLALPWPSKRLPPDFRIGSEFNFVANLLTFRHVRTPFLRSRCRRGCRLSARPRCFARQFGVFVALHQSAHVLQVSACQRNCRRNFPSTPHSRLARRTRPLTGPTLCRTDESIKNDTLHNKRGLPKNVGSPTACGMLSEASRSPSSNPHHPTLPCPLGLNETRGPFMHRRVRDGLQVVEAKRPRHCVLRRVGCRSKPAAPLCPPTSVQRESKFERCGFCKLVGILQDKKPSICDESAETRRAGLWSCLSCHDL